jgi:hypothetical protein
VRPHGLTQEEITATTFTERTINKGFIFIGSQTEVSQKSDHFWSKVGRHDYVVTVYPDILVGCQGSTLEKRRSLADRQEEKRLKLESETITHTRKFLK